MDVEPVVAVFLAWLATAAVHGAVLTLAALGLHAALAKFVRQRRALAAARERLWKVAFFGGIVTATLSSAGARVWSVPIPLARPAAAIALPERAAPAAIVPITHMAAPRTAPERRSAAIEPGWLDVAALAWLAGAAIAAAAWVRDHRRLARMLRGSLRVESGLAHEALDRVQRRADERRRVALSIAPGIAAPITLGLRAPRICLPPRAETDLMPGELDAVLAHELAHARARDPRLLALCRAVEVIFFFQPLFRLARARLVEEVELRCDETAARWTGDPVSLASSLTEVATWIVGERRGLYVPAMAARGSRLERRVRGLLERARPHSPQGPHGAPQESGREWLALPATLVLAAAPLAAPALAVERADVQRADVQRAGAQRAGAPGASGGASAPSEPAPAFSDLGTPEELDAYLAMLEYEYVELLSEPALAAAPDDVRVDLDAIGSRLNTLRELRARLDQLLAEPSSDER